MTLDHGLLAAGLVAAVASCAFATVMIARNDGPTVARTGYFSVFAQLRGKAAGKRAAAPSPRPGDDIDPVVTGSIRTPASPQTNSSPGPALQGFNVREVFDSTALVDSPSGLQVVTRGSILLGAGPVTAITRRGSRVIVETPKGSVWADVQ